MRRSSHLRAALGAAVLLAAGAVGMLLAAMAVLTDGASGPTAFAGALVAAALLAAGTTGAWRLRRPAHALEPLTTALRRLEAGYFEYRIPLPEAGEAQDAARAFNRAAEAAHALIARLEGQGSKLSVVLDTMADGVVVVDEADRIVLMNRAARSMLVQPAMGAAAVVLEKYLRDHDLQQLVRVCRDARERRQQEVEVPRQRRMLSAVATPLMEGEHVHVLLTLHDLTPMRLIETTRREFVTNVSHELRSPLASVKALAETLEGGALEDHEKAFDFLARIRREADRMNAMIGDMLQLASVESGTARFERLPVDLEALTEDVAASLRHRAQDKGVELSTLAGPDAAKASGDVALLREVMMNLLDNALKFTPPGGRVTVRVRKEEDDASMLRVEVTDTGVGIAPEHLPHVFERFYKADRSRRDGGTGLGLAIANHIVRLHGGAISAHSVEGEGATFSFTVPAAG